MLQALLIIVTMIVSILLIAVVLMQSGKGMGLAGGLSGLGTAQVLGVRRTADALSKSTAILATLFLLLCVIAEFATSSKTADPETKESVIQRSGVQKPLPAPGGLPTSPVE